MSTVLLLSLPFHGQVYPMRGLAKELVERGEKVYFYSEDSFRQAIESTGAQFCSYKDFKKIFSDIYFTQLEEEYKNTYLSLMVKALAISKRITETMIEEFSEKNADYIIYDSFAYWGKQVSKLLKIPAISFTCFFVLNEIMFKHEPDFFYKRIFRMPNYPIEIVNRILDKAVKAYGQKYGINDLKIFDAIVALEELNLVYVAPEFHPYSNEYGNSFKFVGTDFIERDNEIEFPYEELDGRPLVYITFGSSPNEVSIKKLYKKSIKAFGNSDMQVVFSTGNKIDIEEISDKPDNFIVRKFVPQLEILKRCHLYITHGGFSGVSEAIYNNIPMVVIPQEYDQFLTAKQIEKFGLGIYIKNADYEASDLKEAAEKILSDESYRINCKHMADIFRKAGGSKKAVDEIFKFKQSNKIK